MSKNESISHLASFAASKTTSDRRLPMTAEIGFVGLGHMGTAMAANLAAAGHRVIAYVRRPDQMDRLVALGLNPTTESASYSAARSLSACCRTTPPLARSCLDEKTSVSAVSPRD
ncbi:MAG: binding domain of 6-phosphogluconate dehydrogenase [Alphaproteobacteria bacterium]|jgi:3-hydroxyisobutyrate dehydrogenase-like beta-hydroxyacid dehydrogenase|nr:binding domain of 6-phosphogluconate dehydrogenase [Alphaproteobacteria bacterium]